MRAGRGGAAGRASALGTRGAGLIFMWRTAGRCTAYPVFAQALVAGEIPAPISTSSHNNRLRANGGGNS
jgi:hypothetical protein